MRLMLRPCCRISGRAARPPERASMQPTASQSAAWHLVRHTMDLSFEDRVMPTRGQEVLSFLCSSDSGLMDQAHGMGCEHSQHIAVCRCKFRVIAFSSFVLQPLIRRLQAALTPPDRFQVPQLAGELRSRQSLPCLKLHACLLFFFGLALCTILERRGQLIEAHNSSVRKVVHRS